MRDTEQLSYAHTFTGEPSKTQLQMIFESLPHHFHTYNGIAVLSPDAFLCVDPTYMKKVPKQGDVVNDMFDKG